MCEVEWHGELSEGGDQGVGGGHQLPGHAIHADDEQPLTEPCSQPGGYSDCHGLIMKNWVGHDIFIEEGVADEKECSLKKTVLSLDDFWQNYYSIRSYR